MQNYHPKTKTEFTEILNKYYPQRNKCIYCGDDIYYENTKVSVNEKNPQEPNLTTSSGPTTLKTVCGKTYSLCVCQKCLEKKLGRPKNYSRIFNSCNPFTQYAFNIPQDDLNKHNKEHAVTKENMIRDYGEKEGLERWNNYCRMQANVNTFEYKHKKYGWTKEQFDEYNKSRAVTKKNLISRYGEEEGLERWNSYVSKQIKTKSREYMIAKFGLEEVNNINKHKAITLDNMIRLYGEEEGKIRFDNFQKNKKHFYSNISQKFFNEIDKLLGDKYTTYYATKNDEWYVCFKGGDIVFLDYYIKELNICIEFNGTAFHADPLIYNSSDHPNPFNKELTATDIWKLDKDRYKRLYDNYYIKTVVVWEREYTADFDFKKFINEKLDIKL